jgi:cholesterol transport system auxiliary component
MKPLITLWLALTLGACSLGPPQKDAAATYDFGGLPAPASGQPRIRASLLVHAVAAPGWLEGYSIIYRLNYQDAARSYAYANSRWAAPAAALLTQRLRAQLALSSDGGILNVNDGARADYALRVELDDFSQIFDSATASRAVITARASIVSVTRRALLAQKTFAIDRPAQGANADGGARALAAAGSELVDAVTAWTAASLAQDKK